MQSLGFIKMVGDSNLAIGRPSSPSIPIQIQKRRSLSFGIVASSPSSSSNSNPNSNSSSSSSSSFLSRSQTYALLKQQMAVATKLEDYKEAAWIRNSLKSFEAEEPVLRLHGLWKKAVEEERFENALTDPQRIRTPSVTKYWKPLAEDMDESSGIEAEYHHKNNRTHVIAFDGSLQKNLEEALLLADAISDLPSGMRVQVRSIYIEGRSLPSKGQYFFAYGIRITNNSQRPVQPLRRHWIITDANGKTENIWGVGVIEEQPVILPGTGFEYSSACPLSTPNGRMEGDFEMKHIDKVGSSTFNVAIAPFSLSIIGDDGIGGLL